MRHTLLPTQERKDLRREYYARLAIIVCCMVSIVFIVGLTLLLPAYMRAISEEQRQLVAVAELKHVSDKKSDSTITSKLSFDSSALDILENSFLRERPSDAIEHIVGLRDKVRLNSLSYFVLGTTTAEVIIQGIAPNRASLLSFKDRLENMIPEARIDLPLSELAKSSSIPFSLKVVYKIP